MKRLNEIESELSGIAPVLGKNGTTAQPYSVPDGYFAHFSEILLNRIHSESGLFLKETDISNTVNALSRTEFGDENPLSELASLSPFLAKLERKTPYQVPVDYFREFQAKKENPVPSERTSVYAEQPAVSKAKLILFHSGTRFMKYAVAAVAAGIIATTTFFALRNTSADPLSSLTNVSDQEMANYLENHDVHWGPGASAPTVSVDFSDNDISDLLSNISDTELEQYLPDQKQNTN
ncbi:MAG: hypothetical protein Q8918_09490 [Bacteroidota bacterium]|nr:hypothetical protein [Bacteroidota bacterium]MDP4250324.1 hypothetical protein [Bacteroidota bacterium]